VDEGNVSEQLKKIDEIIEKYKGQEIAKKALYKKIMLLYKLKKYGEILQLADEIETIKEKYFKNIDFIKKVAREYAVSLLSDNKCAEALKIIIKYKLSLEKKYDDDVYGCAMRNKNYELASVVCNKYLNSPDDSVFIKWIERKIDALEGLRDYKNVVVAVDDLCRVKKRGCYEYRLKKFFALWNLKRYKEALKTVRLLEKKQDIRNTDAFIKIVNWALENGDTLTAAQFAGKIVKLQDSFNVYPYSPFADFTYAKYTKNKKEAQKTLIKLLDRVKGEDRARALYMLANITGDKKYVKECLDVNGSTLWRNLCKDALDLF